MSDNRTRDAIGMALAMYANEPCRICGKTITEADVSQALFAGYSQRGSSRSAHRRCWYGMVEVARGYFSKYGHHVEAVDWEVVHAA